MRTFLLRLLRPLFVLLATLGSLSPALAQMNIEITGVGQSLYPIAVMRFEDEGKLPVGVTEIIRQNLARSGYFKNTESGKSGKDQ
jgi:TolB protein